MIPKCCRIRLHFTRNKQLEKSLKAILVERGIHFPRTHDLEALIEMIQAAAITWPLAARQIDALTPFAAETRYPGALGQVSTAEAEAAIRSAEAVFEWASSQTG
jgi:HEPN domain-containing protein